MIQEDYVSFDVAKLLKEKGYNESIMTCMTVEDLPQFNMKAGMVTLNNYFVDGESKCILAPSLAQAAKWLRDSNQIFVTAYPEYDKRYETVVYRVRVTGYWELINNQKGTLLPLWFEKYEEALNEGIKEALKMI